MSSTQLLNRQPALVTPESSGPQTGAQPSNALAERLVDFYANPSALPHRLPSERQMAQDLNVSRPSIRTALVSLTCQGVVEQRGRQRWLVALSNRPLEAPLSEPQVADETDALSILMDTSSQVSDDFFTFRKALEGELAFAAANNRNTEGRQALTRAYDALNDAFEAGSHHQIAQADFAFHMAIADASANPVLKEANERLLRVLRHQMQQSHVQFESNTELVAQLQSQHKALKEAIVNGQAIQAKALAEQHIAAVYQARNQLVDSL